MTDPNATNKPWDLRVVLLGTGTPRASLERYGPATLVETNDGRRMLFDCGRGVPIRARAASVPIPSVNPLFITHLHSDHVSGIPDFWLTSWVQGRAESLRVMGPPGTKALAENLQRAYEVDGKFRMADEKLPERGFVLSAADVSPGVVLDERGLKVTAFEVDHGELLRPAFGYRIDFHGRSVVLSGDTRPSEAVVRAATGSDVLVHEIAAANPAFLQEGPRPPGTPPAHRLVDILAHHTQPEAAGEMFARARPKLVVYSHIVLDGVSNADLVARTREHYQGPLEVGEDLMTLEVGQAVEVRRPPAHEQK